MGLIRPATPGFLVTLAAAVLLAIVVFSVPYFKSVFFLKASLADTGISGSITFGVLGYCTDIQGNSTCSHPSVGYDLDINKLVGNNSSIQIPSVIVKWITYAFVLHIVALVLACISAVFGLLAHVREFSMTCCSTLFSGGAAAVALIAFIFDIAFFFVAKSRINSVKGGSASLGTGIWLTLAAWLLLFFAGCFFGLGRCCISRRPRDTRKEASQVDGEYADQMRMDAIKAEQDRKARQQGFETGLPAFSETQPLTSKMDGGEEWMEDGDHIVPYQRPQANAPGGAAGIGAGTAAYARQNTSPSNNYAAGGYAQAPPGTRAVDDYYNARPSQAASQYPPQPRRQGSVSTQYTQSSNTYTSATPAPIPPVPSSNAYLAAGAGAAAYGARSQNVSAASQQYGHPERGNTYQSAASHQQYPTNYSQYADPAPTAFNSDAYNATAYMAQPVTASTYAPQSASTHYAASSTAYTPYGQNSSQAQSYNAPERSYTLGGDSYAQPQQPPSQPHTPFQPQHQQSQYYADPTRDASNTLFPPTSTHNEAHNSMASYLTSPYSPMPSPNSPSEDVGGSTMVRAQSMHKPPLDLPAAAVGASHSSTSGPSMPAPSHGYEQPTYEDSPPVYDDATAQPPGQWGAKH
ncbi:SUR7/PalI family-domain-containing protein [Irpex rosettiformis]|uniref:SUR7/PalI family-domain-containing protein n=1 Tax=Irpex rosettiformis TaxID=378272 RepID=A0ACB8UIJ3_9APHY|nr:SUR7/PalI family-domain-containing protein [Irpex rosettiformis]